ncbi:MAG: hypothetical protein ABIS92_00180 [Polyangia bacterium]
MLPTLAGEAPWRRHATVVLVALAYLSVWPYFERLNNPNENVRVWMTRAIVEHHTLAIDKVSTEWGYVNDKAVARGHVFSGKAPGTSLVGVPVLWLQTKLWHATGWPSPSKHATTMALRLFTVMLPSLAFLFFFARWTERRTRAPVARDLLVVALGAGTMLFPYGILFVGHAQAAIAAFSSFMVLTWLPPGTVLTWLPPGMVLTWLPPGSGGGGDVSAASPSRSPSSTRIAVAGALAGAAVLLEYQLLLIVVLLALYAVWAVRGRALWFIVGALPFAIALGAYHAALFGRPWSFPYGHLENQDFAHIHDVGYHGLAGPRLTVLATSLFSASYGLFAYSPHLLLALGLGTFAAVAGRGRARIEGLLVLSVMLVMSLFISGLSNWRAGWCVGPRYIAGAVPFLILGPVLTAPLWTAPSRRGQALRVLMGGLVAASVFANGLSAAVYPHYPEVFDNPIHDLALPLVREGYQAYGLGWALRLPGAWSLLPVALFLGTAWLVGMVGGVGKKSRASRVGAATNRPREYRSPLVRLVRVAAAALVAIAFTASLSVYGRGQSAGERAAAAAVRSLWQPQRSTPSTSAILPARPAAPPPAASTH